MISNNGTKSVANMIQRFHHTHDVSVAAVMVNDEPWLRAKDVAAALGYANPHQAIRHNVDERDRSQLKDLMVLKFSTTSECVQDRTQLKDFKRLPGSTLPGCNKGDVETHSDSEQTTSGELGSLPDRPTLQCNAGA